MNNISEAKKLFNVYSVSNFLNLAPNHRQAFLKSAEISQMMLAESLGKTKGAISQALKIPIYGAKYTLSPLLLEIAKSKMLSLIDDMEEAEININDSEIIKEKIK